MRKQLAVACIALGSLVFLSSKANAQYSVVTLASFANSDGTSSNGPLALDEFGNIYGTTASGGSNSDGTVYELPSGSTTVNTLVTFNGSTNGIDPLGLVADASGNVYGTTYGGGPGGEGTVFKINAGSQTFSNLVAFNFGNGSQVEAPLIIDSAGNLYGTTYSGTDNNAGQVFEIPAGTSNLKSIATEFESSVESESGSQTYGQGPYTAVAMDSSGNLYGATYYGGTNGRGVVYKIGNSGTGYAFSNLASFGSGTQDPTGNIAVDSSGDVYGVETVGPSNSNGYVYEYVAPSGSGSVQILKEFIGDAAGQIVGGLVADSTGDIFGTLESAFGVGNGSVFEIAAGTHQYSTVATFNGTTLGGNPSGNLTIDSHGNLYGTTTSGGANGDGTIFELLAPSAPATTGSVSLYSGGGNVSTGVVDVKPGTSNGAVDVTFASATVGVLSVTYDPSLTPADLVAGTQGGIEGPAPTFELPTGSDIEAWELNLTGGTLSGDTQIVFYYDPAELQPGVDPSTLHIFHYTGGSWQDLGGTVNTTNDTITVNDTQGFSPFALGEVDSVPEPGSLSLLGAAVGSLLIHRRSARKAR